jgi:hypothetical protein
LLGESIPEEIIVEAEAAVRKKKLESIGRELHELREGKGLKMPPEK